MRYYSYSLFFRNSFDFSSLQGGTFLPLFQTLPSSRCVSRGQQEAKSQEATGSQQEASSQGLALLPTSKQGLSWEEAVVLLCTIPGIGERAARAILAEIGVNMQQFPTAVHLASWAAVCPGNHESAGK